MILEHDEMFVRIITKYTNSNVPWYSFLDFSRFSLSQKKKNGWRMQDTQENEYTK